MLSATTSHDSASIMVSPAATPSLSTIATEAQNQILVDEEMQGNNLAPLKTATEAGALSSKQNDKPQARKRPSEVEKTSSVCLDKKRIKNEIATAKSGETTITRPKQKRGVGRWLVKKIRSCVADWQKALQLLEDHKDVLESSVDIRGNAVAAVIYSMGRAQQLQEAHAFFKRTTAEHKELLRPCGRALMSAAGECGDWKLSLQLLNEMKREATNPPALQDYHAALSACVKCEQLEEMFLLLTEMEQESAVSPDLVAYMTALTACLRQKKGPAAADLLRRMKDQGVAPTIQSYNRVLLACSSAEHYKLGLQVLEEMELEPNCMSYRTVMGACVRAGDWGPVPSLQKQIDAAERAEQALSGRRVKHKKISDQQASVTSDQSPTWYQQQLKKLTKVGKGKAAWREIGAIRLQNNNSFQTVRLGIQTHRDPAANGLSLVFMDPSGDTKLAYMLVRNTAEPETGRLTSSMLGMYIEPEYRGMGLSPLFVAAWLSLCSDLNAAAATEKINKPLLSLVLKRFGFLPMEGGTKVEICRTNESKICPIDGKVWYPKLALYSSCKSLHGVFTERDLRNQEMAIMKDTPDPRGKLVFVGTGFTHPAAVCGKAKQTLKRGLEQTLGKNLVVDIDIDLLRNALFGFLFIQ